MVMSAALLAGLLLVSCGQTDDTEGLEIKYECYADEATTIDYGSGPMESRVCYFILENTTDKELRYAEVKTFGLDGNGERLQRADGEVNKTPTYMVPSLMPGESAIIQAFDAEWVEIPASFEVRVTGKSWGSCEGVPLSVIDTSQTGPYAWQMTLRNDGDEEMLWVNDFSNQDLEIGRQPVVVAVIRDDDGNVESIDRGTLLDGNQIMTENITIAPGEEKTVEVCFSGKHQDPEFIICWN